MCKRYQRTYEIPALPRYRHTRLEIPLPGSRCSHNSFFLSFLNKHYFYNQVMSVFIPWLGTRPGYKFELNFTGLFLSFFFFPFSYNVFYLYIYLFIFFFFSCLIISSSYFFFFSFFFFFFSASLLMLFVSLKRKFI